jgi:hypothetical protein
MAGNTRRLLTRRLLCIIGLDHAKAQSIWQTDFESPKSAFGLGKT